MEGTLWESSESYCHAFCNGSSVQWLCLSVGYGHCSSYATAWGKSLWGGQGVLWIPGCSVAVLIDLSATFCGGLGWCLWIGKWAPEGAVQHIVFHLLNLVYVGVLQRNVCLLVESQSGDEQCSLHPGCGTLELFILKKYPRAYVNLLILLSSGPCWTL